jgi:ABC-type oligopeptide transport system substrate-binding subunit
VGNGPFRWTYWRQNDRYEFVPSESYWDRASVRLDRVVAYAVDDLNTSTNLYKSGAIDWNPSGYIPSQYLGYMKPYADYRTGRYQGTYFYSLNVTRPPLDDVRVRRALNLAIDRESIARDLLKGSREAWGRVTPAGYPGYLGPVPVKYDPVRAREWLAQAGYPGGKGFPRISILFNTSEDHRRIAEAIQAMWKRDLGIDIELSSQEWAISSNDRAPVRWPGALVDETTSPQHVPQVSHEATNNRTGWSDSYDALLRRPLRGADPRPDSRCWRSRAIALDEAPFLPIYHYFTTELVKPWVRGIHQTALDVHLLTRVWIDHEWRQHEPLAEGDAR